MTFKKSASYSLLTSLDNPKWVKYRIDNPDAEDDDKRHFRIGGAIDMILTQPVEEFQKQYAVLEKSRPNGMMGIFIDALPLDLTEESSEEEYMEAYTKSGFKWSITNCIKSLWELEKYRDYYMARKKCAGKTIISYDEYEEIMHCHDYIINNPYTSKYFINNDPNVELVFQYGFNFVWEDVPVKGFIDVIKIDHKNRSIQIGDLKTTAKSVKAFKRSYIQYKYYLQAALYKKAIEILWIDGHRLSENIHHLGKPVYKYKLEEPVFIVTEKKPYHSNPARIFRCSPKDIEVGWEGGYLNGFKVKGFKELIEDYKWHVENDYWDLPKDLVESEGEIELQVFS
jgi:hypothetical protein